MALRNIRTMGDECLNKVCKEVKEINDRTRTLIEDMIDTMYEANGVGLAAPQVGILKRIVVIDCTGEDLLVMINPKIIETSGEQTGGEGCLSVDRETCGITPRHKRITVEAHLYNLQTQTVEFKKFDLKDYIAIVFQHEYDHLFGTLYVDTIMDENKAEKSGLTPLWEIEE